MYARTDDFVRTKISWMHRKPNFINHGAPLRARAPLTVKKFASVGTTTESYLFYASVGKLLVFPLLETYAEKV